MATGYVSSFSTASDIALLARGEPADTQAQQILQEWQDVAVGMDDPGLKDLFISSTAAYFCTVQLSRGRDAFSTQSGGSTVGNCR